jgi:hypothetical protein
VPRQARRAPARVRGEAPPEAPQLGAIDVPWRSTILTLLHALTIANFALLRLTMRSPDKARQYGAESLQRYRELMGLGLRPRDPLNYLGRRGWSTLGERTRIELPPWGSGGGGTRPTELLVLATVTRALQPRKIFEIGTYQGRTTSIFALNAPAGASVLSLDLPPDAEEGARTDTAAPENLSTDLELARMRDPGLVVRQLGLASRYEQLLADSLAFDPAPHAGTVELGFIDGAHALPYVVNDTRKMAVMMAERGLVFWHDYGGQGSFRDLTTYLEALAREIPVYRVPDTTLAWTPAGHLRRLAGR